MNTCPDASQILVFPHLNVQNANAISSPLTHGFPSITAFLGVMWALERKAQAAGLDVRFSAVGVVCHNHQEQTSDGGYVKTFNLSRNPVGKDGTSSAIVEEGRIHLQLSLLLSAESQRWQQAPETREQDLAYLAELLAGMRIAGGSVIPAQDAWRNRYKPWLIELTGSKSDQLAVFAKAKMRLLPGYTLVSRDDLLEQRIKNGSTTLDAWLSFARVNWQWQAEEQKWQRSGDKGWLVPIPVGYGALSPVQPAGTVANARDNSTDFCFVESLYSVGEWLSPHRLKKPQDLLWYAKSDTQSGCYRCANDYATQPCTQQSVALELDNSY